MDDSFNPIFQKINEWEIMIFMNEIDYLSLDGKTLRLFLAVLEEGSVTAAAHRLGLTQSAVSHGLERLRAVAGDPLFVKSGRGILATAHAELLAEQARQLLDGMKAFSSGASFAPASARFRLTVAANDFQRDLLLPGFFARVRAAAPGILLRVIPSGAPTAEMLREERCDLLVTPRPPEGADILQKRLLADRFLCFYDAARRSAPRSLQAYLAAGHVTVEHENRGPLEFDTALAARGIDRRIVVTVQNFSGVPPFLRGSDMIATLPGLLGRELLREFRTCPPPVDYPELPMYAVWHRRNHLDPAHRWLRGILEESAKESVGARRQSA